MPEKSLSTRHVGMETLGSSGSCDSMESISSNHSAFSGDSLDYLSAEERECLMFLEETIDSLDNEVDSGVSNDEAESAQTVPRPSSVQSQTIPLSNGDGKIVTESSVLPKPEKKTDRLSVDLNKIITPRQGYHSFPRIVQGPKEDLQKHPSQSSLIDPKSDQEKSLYGKPKSLTSINTQEKEDTISNLFLLPPPEPFRDPQFVDKRRSVTDPTDARESRFESLFPRSLVHKEAPADTGAGNFKVTAPPVSPKPLSSNPVITLSQQALNASEKQTGGQVKQGPPTAPKPRRLPPHIIVKPGMGGGVALNLDPQQRPRAFSAHERNLDKNGEAVKLPHSKEQESARQEALKMLGLLQEEAKPEDHGSNKPTTMTKNEETSFSHGLMLHGQKDTYGKTVTISHQEKSDILGSSPAKSPVLVPSEHKTINEDLRKNRLSMKSNSLEKSDESGGSLFLNEGSPRSVRSDINGNRPSVKMDPLGKVDNMGGSSHPPKDVPKNIKIDIGRNPSIPKTSTPQKAAEGQQAHAISTATPELIKVNKTDERRIKEGSSQSVPLSTSPAKPFSFPRPKDLAIPSTSPSVVLREEKNKAAVNKSNRHSSPFEPAGEDALRLPQGPLPGLRQINIKSNTLERSGIGLSSSVQGNDGQTQKGGAFFKKPIFSGNFLRNNRPRPASLGTGKDFVSTEPPTTVVEATESSRSFFTRRSRPPPVTSVKITPKGSTDEHRREALKKLGILKE